ncbi:c-type cytochrome [Marinobacterium aestuariivivens]|uniref:C-type cytochrome n=1 Tax=Marinobacterium aestuariivivens TaxID=1698799 RepID=A0ABW2A7W1_9GAMM
MKTVFVWGSAVVLSATVASGVVMAHGGATGVVKERMELMKDLKGSMKSLSEMFSGKADYDAAKVREAAAVLEAASGEAMTRLFPEGSLHGPTEAKPGIWQEWERFQGLADDLGVYSRALAESADNRGGAGGQGSGTMMGTRSMMGGQSMMGTGGMMGGAPSAEHLAQMPSEMVFKMVTDTCSSCHTRYRVEKED